MPAYRELQPGLYELDLPGGPLPVTATEDELRAEGHFPDSLSIHKTGATAQLSPVASPGFRMDLDAERQASDIARSKELAARQGMGDMGGPRAFDPLRGYSAVAKPQEGQNRDLAREARELVERKSKVSDAEADRLQRAHDEKLQKAGVAIALDREAEDKPAAGLRGGGDVTQIGGGSSGGSAQGPQGARFAKVGGKDIRAGFTIQKSLLDPQAIAEADASEDLSDEVRREAAQNIADRRGTQTEALSAEMGRQLKREGVALRQQEERNKAQAEDYEQRQLAIERERDEVAKLNVSPAELIEEGGLTGIIAALTILAAAPAAAYNGGRNLAKEAIQENLDRKLAKAKDKVAGKETDFDRMVKIYGSPAEAEAEFRDRQRLFVQQMGQKMATDAGALDAADALRMQFADWDDERAQSRLARQQALAGSVAEQWAYQPERTVQVGGPRPETPEQRRRRVELPNGGSAYALTEEEAKTHRESLAAGSVVSTQLGKLRNIMSDGQPWTPEKRGAAQAIAAGLALDMKNADKAGALDEGTKEIVTQLTSNPSDFFNPAATARIDQAAERQNLKTSTIVRGLYRDPDATQRVAPNRPQTTRAD